MQRAHCRLKSYAWILDCTGIHAPNPCIVQGPSIKYFILLPFPSPILPSECIFFLRLLLYPAQGLAGNKCPETAGWIESILPVLSSSSLLLLLPVPLRYQWPHSVPINGHFFVFILLDLSESVPGPYSWHVFTEGGIVRSVLGTIPSRTPKQIASEVCLKCKPLRYLHL